MKDLAQSPGLKIFIVENHPDTLRSLEMYLKMMGHQVMSANSMSTALEKLPESDADVLLSDIGLPDGDGWTLLKEVKLQRPVYAIAMSGYGMESDQQKSSASGFRYHLLKPFCPEDLDELLEAAARECAHSV